jgi:hypothetical protein
VRRWPLWLKVPLGAFVVGAVGLAAALAAIAAGTLLGAAIAGIAAVSALVAPSVLSFLTSRQTQASTPLGALEPAYPPASQPAYPRVLPPSLGGDFVGRSEVLRDIHDILGRQTETGGANRPILWIEGFGGVGKTRLALEYLHRYGPQYPGGLFWVDADTTAERLEEQFHGILQALRPETPALFDLRKNNVAVAARLADALCEIPADTPALFIVDNVPEPVPGCEPEPIAKWCPAPGRVTLLGTSRLKVSLADGVESVTLPELQPEASVAVLTQKLQRASSRDEDWSAIAGWVGRLPLALVILNAALRDHAVSATQLRDLVKADPETTGPLDRQREALRGQVPKGQLRGVAEAFATSYSRLSADGQHMARLVSYLAPDPVPEAILGAIGSDVATPRARAELAARSFVTPVFGTAVPAFGRMHRVVADFVRGQAHDADAEMRELLIPLLTILNPAALERWEDWPALSATIPHALTLSSRLESDSASPQNTIDASLLRERIAYGLRFRGDIASARKLQEQVLIDRERILGLDHQDTIAAAGHLALTLRTQGSFSAARALEERVLASRTRILGSEHPSTLDAAGQLALTLCALGDLDTARKLQERVFEQGCLVFGPDHHNTLTAAGNLAAIIWAEGDVVATRTIQEKVYEDSRRLLGPKHHDTIVAAGNLALVLRAQKDHVALSALREQVYSERPWTLIPYDEPIAPELGVAMMTLGLPIEEPCCE